MIRWIGIQFSYSTMIIMVSQANLHKIMKLPEIHEVTVMDEDDCTIVIHLNDRFSPPVEP